MELGLKREIIFKDQNLTVTAIESETGDNFVLQFYPEKDMKIAFNGNEPIELKGKITRGFASSEGRKIAKLIQMATESKRAS